MVDDDDYACCCRWRSIAK